MENIPEKLRFSYNREYKSQWKSKKYFDYEETLKTWNSLKKK